MVESLEICVGQQKKQKFAEKKKITLRKPQLSACHAGFTMLEYNLNSDPII